METHIQIKEHAKATEDKDSWSHEKQRKGKRDATFLQPLREPRCGHLRLQIYNCWNAAEAPSLGQLLGWPWKLTHKMRCQPFSKVVDCYTNNKKSQNRGGKPFSEESNLVQLLRTLGKAKAV